MQSLRPNSGYLETTPTDYSSLKTYCLNSDAFDPDSNEVCEYNVYSVATGELLYEYKPNLSHE